MIDRDLIDSMPDDQAKIIRGAIVTLASSGILTAQMQRMFARLAEGNIDQEVADLADNIKDYRFKVAGLRALQQFGESILEEYKS